MIAKYCPRGGILGTKNKRGTSSLWRQIQDLKSFFFDNTCWDMQDGTKIKAVNQPWYEGWEIQRIMTNEQRDVVVSQLYDHSQGKWDEEKIIQLLGAQAVQHIVNTVRVPAENTILTDRLIWKLSSKGSYTVKEGYYNLSQEILVPPRYTTQQRELWKKIGTWKEIIPRVRIFLWRASHGGLPVMGTLHARINHITPLCPRCGQEEEDIMHTIFTCTVARLTWFASQFSLRTDALPADFSAAMILLTAHLTSQDVATFCNIIWCLWKARNEAIFSAKKPTPCSILATSKGMTWIAPKVTNPTQTQPIIQIPAGKAIILIDGSWGKNERAGTGMVIFDRRGNLVRIHGGYHTTPSPFEAEALALLQALRYIESEPAGEYIILTDCSNLVKAIQSKRMDDLPHWQAARTVEKCIRIIQAIGNRSQLRYTGREALSQPHSIANWVRRRGEETSGYPSTSQMEELRIEHSIDQSIFQLEEG